MNPLAQQLAIALAPSVLPTLMVMVGILLNNSRLSDLNKRIEELKSDFGKRLDDLRSETGKQFAEVIKRLARIEFKLDDHERRVIRLEERASPLVRA